MKPSYRMDKSSSYWVLPCWECPAWQRSSWRSPTRWNSSASTLLTMSASSSYCYLTQVNIYYCWTKTEFNVSFFFSAEVRNLNNRAHVQESSEQVHQILLEYCHNCYPNVPVSGPDSQFLNDDINSLKIPIRRHHNVHRPKLFLFLMLKNLILEVEYF